MVSCGNASSTGFRTYQHVTDWRALRVAGPLRSKVSLPSFPAGLNQVMLDLPHVASRVFGTPLMIARAKLEVILGVLAPRLAGSPLEPVDPEADPAPLTSITVERIAVVSVIGTLVSRSGYLDAASGLLAYGDIGDAIASAMDDPSVRGVILDVDSPGGEVGGLFDLVDQIRAIKAAQRQAAVGGRERKRAVGRLCDRECRRPALRDADRRSRIGRRGRGSCRRERGRRQGGPGVDLRVRGRTARSTAMPMSRSPSAPAPRSRPTSTISTRNCAGSWPPTAA